MTLRVALAQIDCALGDVAENALRATTAIADARAGGADLIVFPELALTGYLLSDLVPEVAMRATDPRLAALSASAPGGSDPAVWIVTR